MHFHQFQSGFQQSNIHVKLSAAATLFFKKKTKSQFEDKLNLEFGIKKIIILF